MREDFRYKREETRNLFLIVEPKAGLRMVQVARRWGKRDFAQAMRYLVEVLYPHSLIIDAVLDNHNSPTYRALVERLAKQRQTRLSLTRIFTPPGPMARGSTWRKLS